jgi:hypothetical protein
MKSLLQLNTSALVTTLVWPVVACFVPEGHASLAWLFGCCVLTWMAAFLWALWMQLGGWIMKHLEKASCWSLVLLGNPQPTPTASALPWSIWEWALLILVVVLHCIAAGFVFREMERDVNPTANNFTPHGATGIDPL